MKTVYVITDHDYIGGAEVNYKEIITAYQNVDVHIVFIAPGTGNIKSFFDENKLTQVRYRNLPAKYSSLRVSSGQISLRNILSNYIAFKRNRKFLLGLISIEKPLAIVSNAIFGHILVSSLPKFIVRVAHIQDIVDRKQFFGIYGKILDYILINVDKVISISDAVIDNFLGKYRYKVHKVYNPVQVPKGLVQTTNEVFLVGMFARYVDWKGHKELLEIVKQVKATGTEKIKFVCFGNAYGNESYFKSLQEEVRRNNLSEYINLNTFSNHVIHEMNKCDIILHLSVKPEPFGRILIEANMLKKPVLAYDGGGVVELFNNLKLVGDVVKVGDNQAMAKAILDFKKRTLDVMDFPELEDLSPERYVRKFMKIILDRNANSGQ